MQPKHINLLLEASFILINGDHLPGIHNEERRVYLEDSDKQ